MAMNLVDIASIGSISDTLPVLTSNPGLLLAETDPWVQPTALVLGPFLNFLSLAMVRLFVAQEPTKSGGNTGTSAGCLTLAHV